MKFSGDVDNGPRKRGLHFGDVPDSIGTITFDLLGETLLKTIRFNFAGQNLGNIVWFLVFPSPLYAET